MQALDGIRYRSVSVRTPTEATGADAAKAAAGVVHIHIVDATGIVFSRIKHDARDEEATSPAAARRASLDEQRTLDVFADRVMADGEFDYESFATSA